MTFVTPALNPQAIPAAVHCNGTSRLQTICPSDHPRLALLLEAFRQKTGIGCLLNTSFNVAEEPIVCSPSDALGCFRESGIDALVLENHLILRRECSSEHTTPGARRFLEYARELRQVPSNTYTLT
ncbi:Decarbamoylnovobiocin carbamoyltransferase [compost metagenome]